MPASPDPRTAQLARGVLVLLAGNPDGLIAQEVFDRMAVAVPPTPSELRADGTSEGVRAYEDAIRRSTSAAVRVGWLTKAGGVWRITELGQRSLSRFPDPLEFQRTAISQRDWELSDRNAPSDVGDVFAGCFLSIGGALVGAAIGTVVLFVRMLPDPTLALVPGFLVAVLAGVVIGFISSFFIAGLALRIGRGVENIWLGGTALAAAAAAALTPSIFIAVQAVGST
jgi:hypothetical protein